MSLEPHNPIITKDVFIKKLGRYEILSELGKGAMGIVYKAVDPVIDRTVAIKTINLNLSGDEIAGFVERFNREAKSAGRLNHPNIVTIYDVGRIDDIAFMAMEHLEGQELKEIIASKQTLQLDRIVEITLQIADALAFAHDNGVVHRDIKPANIMVLRNGVVKIMDFGIAMTSSGSQTQAGTILGSPKYMSPEQISGRVVDGRSDIFSLGAVLYELLTGISSFGRGDSSNNLTSTMYQVINETPDPPTLINPSIPLAFDYIISKALAKKPEERYQSAREMAVDLRNFKRLKTPFQLPSAALPGKKSGEDSSRVAGAAPGISKKKQPVISWWSRRKKLIGILMAVFVLVVAILFIYVQNEPVKTGTEKAAIGRKATAAASKKQSSAKSKDAAGQSKANNNPKTAALAKGSINFTILPWGEVFVDGKRMGASPPLKTIKLSSGNHRIEIRNTKFSPYRKTVKLKAGENVKIRYKFE